MTLETLAGDRFLYEEIGEKRSRSPWSVGRQWKRAARDVILRADNSAGCFSREEDVASIALLAGNRRVLFQYRTITQDPKTNATHS